LSRTFGKAPRVNSLPAGMVPRGLWREQSVGHWGHQRNEVRRDGADGRAPKPKKFEGRRVWDVRQLDRAFDKLDGDDDPENPWGRQREQGGSLHD
jgi:hypothetical protein